MILEDNDVGWNESVWGDETGAEDEETESKCQS